MLNIQQISPPKCHQSLKKKKERYLFILFIMIFVESLAFYKTISLVYRYIYIYI